MQSEITAKRAATELQILGVNEVGHESANETICRDRSIPWLQENLDHRVWQDWDVTYRDVIILDGENRPLAVFNVTTHNLAEPAKYDSLKALLMSFAP